jgi:Zn-dependent protease with chaperone function
VTPRADRRIFSRGTTRRFLLLLIVMLAACPYLLRQVALVLSPEDYYLRCLRAAGAGPGASDLEIRNALLFSEEFVGCRADVLTDAMSIALIGTGAVVAAAVVLYLLLPMWKGRRNRLESISKYAAAGRSATRAMLISHHLAQLADRSGIDRPPTFRVDPRALSAGAVVFGAIGRYTVSLHSGLLTRWTSDPRAFDAVVLHELAHIRNRDVDITYLTVALRRVFLVAVLIPFAAVQGWLLLRIQDPSVERTYWPAEPPDGRLAFSVFLAAMVYLTSAEILRNRELCADLDAVANGADPGVWGSRHMVGTGRRASGLTAPLMAVAGWLLRLWRTHPTWAQRRKVLNRAATWDAGATVSQVVLFIGAMVALMSVFFSDDFLQTRMTSVLFYAALPLVLVTAAVSTPHKHPAFIDEGAVTETGGRSPAWGAAVVVTAIVALIVFDPLRAMRDSRSREGLLNTGALPREFRPTPMQSADPDVRARITAWQNNGGREVITRLAANLGVNTGELVKTAAPRDGGTALAVHCAAIKSAVADAKALPPFPDKQGKETLARLITWADEGSTRLCSLDPKDDNRVALTEITLKYDSAALAHRTFRLLQINLTFDWDPD